VASESIREAAADGFRLESATGSVLVPRISVLVPRIGSGRIPHDVPGGGTAETYLDSCPAQLVEALVFRIATCLGGC
jgi:hypothetical protein